MAKNSKAVQAKADAKRAGKRTRNFTAVLYPEDLPAEWESRLTEMGCKWACSPLHDKDLTPTGEPKKAHYHIVIQYDSVKTIEQVKHFFADLYGASDSGSICGVATPQACGSVDGMIRYFAHLDNPEKHQYDIADARGFCGFDVMEHLRRGLSETVSMMQRVEDIILDQKCTELVDLIQILRRMGEDELYILVATKCTFYFSAYLSSMRGKAKAAGVDPATGEVV